MGEQKHTKSCEERAEHYRDGEHFNCTDPTFCACPCHRPSKKEATVPLEVTGPTAATYEPEQSKNGLVHLTYFDEDSGLSFVWDGRLTFCEVSHGGYAEGVVYRLLLNNHYPPTEHTTLWESMQSFMDRCNEFVSIWTAAVNTLQRNS